jgi:hypothetical protein
MKKIFAICLMLYSSHLFSAEVDTRQNIHRVERNISLNENIQVNVIRVNKNEFGIDKKCESIDSDNHCTPSRLISTNMVNSYLEDFNIYSTIGTGIKLPDEQLETDNGFDD